MTENQGDYKTFADATPTPAPQSTLCLSLYTNINFRGRDL